MKIIRVNAFHSSTAVRVPFAFFIKSTEFHQWRESADEFFFFLLRLLFFCVWFKSSPVAVGFCSLMKKDKIKFGKLNSVSKFVYLYLSTATAVCRQKICLRHFHSPLLLRMYFGHLLADFLGCLPASKCGLTGEGLKQRFCVTRSMVTSRTLAFTFL